MLTISRAAPVLPGADGEDGEAHGAGVPLDEGGEGTWTRRRAGSQRRASRAEASASDDDDADGARIVPLSKLVSEDPQDYTQAGMNEVLFRLSKEAPGGLKFLVSASALLGAVRFLTGYFLILVTEARRVGAIGGHRVFGINHSELVYVPYVAEPAKVMSFAFFKDLISKISRTNTEELEDRYRNLFQSVDLTKDFYFSYSYDLTAPLQQNICIAEETTRGESHGSVAVVADARADPSQSRHRLQRATERGGQRKRRSRHSLSTASDSAPGRPTSASIASAARTDGAGSGGDSSDSDDEPPALAGVAHERYLWNQHLTEELRGCISHCWLVPLIHGFFEQHTATQFGRMLTISLIARRSRHFAGTRYLKRGVNDKGMCANDVEVEQIIATDNGRYSSYVQVRGSIPVYWKQETSVAKPKPDIEIRSPPDPMFVATRKHFADLFQRYGSPILCLNLVKKHEKHAREIKIGSEFASATAYINRLLPPKHRVQYWSLDFSALSHSKKHNVFEALKDAATWGANNTGFYCSAPVSSHGSHRTAQAHLALAGAEDGGDAGAAVFSTAISRMMVHEVGDEGRQLAAAAARAHGARQSRSRSRSRSRNRYSVHGGHAASMFHALTSARAQHRGSIAGMMRDRRASRSMRSSHMTASMRRRAQLAEMLLDSARSSVLRNAESHGYLAALGSSAARRPYVPKYEKPAHVPDETQFQMRNDNTTDLEAELVASRARVGGGDDDSVDGESRAGRSGAAPEAATQRSFDSPAGWSRSTATSSVMGMYKPMYVSGGKSAQGQVRRSAQLEKPPEGRHFGLGKAETPKPERKEATEEAPPPTKLPAIPAYDYQELFASVVDNGFDERDGFGPDAKVDDSRVVDFMEAAVGELKAEEGVDMRRTAFGTGYMLHAAPTAGAASRPEATPAPFAKGRTGRRATAIASAVSKPLYSRTATAPAAGSGGAAAPGDPRSSAGPEQLAAVSESAGRLLMVSPAMKPATHSAVPPTLDVGAAGGAGGGPGSNAVRRRQGGDDQTQKKKYAAVQSREAAAEAAAISNYVLRVAKPPNDGDDGEGSSATAALALAERVREWESVGQDPESTNSSYFYVDLVGQGRRDELGGVDGTLSDGETPTAETPMHRRLKERERMGEMLQSGVVRTNCIDSLDRTNVGQFCLGVHVLGLQLFALGFVESPLLEPRNPAVRVLMQMFESMGDRIALQYGGSEAHKKVGSQAEKHGGAGPPKGDGGSSSKKTSGGGGEWFTSVRRYVSNSFTDMVKQDGMNLFLGVYRPLREPIPLIYYDGDFVLHNESAVATRPVLRPYRDQHPPRWWQDAIDFYERRAAGVRTARLADARVHLIRNAAANRRRRRRSSRGRAHTDAGSASVSLATSDTGDASPAPGDGRVDGGDDAAAKETAGAGDDGAGADGDAPGAGGDPGAVAPGGAGDDGAEGDSKDGDVPLPLPPRMTRSETGSSSGSFAADLISAVGPFAGAAEEIGVESKTLARSGAAVEELVYGMTTITSFDDLRQDESQWPLALAMPRERAASSPEPESHDGSVDGDSERRPPALTGGSVASIDANPDADAAMRPFVEHGLRSGSRHSAERPSALSQGLRDGEDSDAASAMSPTTPTPSGRRLARGVRMATGRAMLSNVARLFQRGPKVVLGDADATPIEEASDNVKSSEALSTPETEQAIAYAQYLDISNYREDKLSVPEEEVAAMRDYLAESVFPAEDPSQVRVWTEQHGCMEYVRTGPHAGLSRERPMKSLLHGQLARGENMRPHVAYLHAKRHALDLLVPDAPAPRRSGRRAGGRGGHKDAFALERRQTERRRAAAAAAAASGAADDAASAPPAPTMLTPSAMPLPLSSLAPDDLLGSPVGGFGAAGRPASTSLTPSAAGSHSSGGEIGGRPRTP